MGTGRGAFVAAAIVVVLVLVGCGGGDDSSASGSISKQEFIAKADAICTKSNKRMESQLGKFLVSGKQISKPTQADNEKFVATVLIPSLRKEIDEIKALGVPAEDEERVTAMIVALEEGLETAENDPRSVAAGSAEVIYGIPSRLAGEYGLKVCSTR
jgi:hypothetical protein